MKTALTVLAAFMWSAVTVGGIVGMAYYSRPPAPETRIDPNGNPLFPPQTAPVATWVAPSAE